jgi:C-terminal processing protease CtpA/Prc
VSVNGVPTTTIIARLLAASPGDGFIATGRAQRVARKFREDLFTHFGMHGQFSLGLGDPIGATATMPGQTMAAIKLASASRYPQDRRQTRFAELSLLDDGTIAHLKIFNFSAEDEDDDGPSILRKAFEKMATSGTQTLLLDLRDNGGGEDVLGKRLFSHLVDAPFRYYEELTVKRAGVSYAEHVEGEAGIPARALTPRADGLYSLGSHPNLGMQKAALPTFSGRVIALINGRSFSTTAELITQLHDKQRATFVGEESGGAYHGNSSGEDVTLVLPNSRLKVAIPLVTYKLAVRGSHPNGRGVVPEYKVVPGIQDYLRGHDVVLEKALALARAR